MQTLTKTIAEGMKVKHDEVISQAPSGKGAISRLLKQTAIIATTLITLYIVARLAAAPVPAIEEPKPPISRMTASASDVLHAVIPKGRISAPMLQSGATVAAGILGAQLGLSLRPILRPLVGRVVTHCAFLGQTVLRFFAATIGRFGISTVNSGMAIGSAIAQSVSAAAYHIAGSVSAAATSLVLHANAAGRQIGALGTSIKSVASAATRFIERAMRAAGRGVVLSVNAVGAQITALGMAVASAASASAGFIASMTRDAGCGIVSLAVTTARHISAHGMSVVYAANTAVQCTADAVRAFGSRVSRVGNAAFQAAIMPSDPMPTVAAQRAPDRNLAAATGALGYILALTRRQPVPLSRVTNDVAADLVAPNKIWRVPAKVTAILSSSFPTLRRMIEPVEPIAFKLRWPAAMLAAFAFI